MEQWSEIRRRVLVEGSSKRAAWPLLLAGGRVVKARLAVQLRRDIAGDLLPRRPDRLEPRRRKRRPKNNSLLVKPRSWYRIHADPDGR